MNHLYDIATGRLESSTALDVTTIPDGRAVKASSKTGVWNTQTLDFDPIPPNTVITMQEFTKRIGMIKMQAILVASKTDIAVETLLRYTDKFTTVDTTDPELMYGMNYLVQIEIFTQAEMDEILK
jgi:hypothetical protein